VNNSGQPGTQTLGVATSTTTSSVLPSNQGRLGLFVQNDDATNAIYINFASVAVTGTGIKLRPNSDPLNLCAEVQYTGPISAIAAAGTPKLLVQEF
jgi:hypothetical protein